MQSGTANIAFLLLSLVSVAAAQEPKGIGESFFVTTVYPMLHAAQCVRCHSDNGVASETSLEFPREGASEAQIAAFGLSLIDLVDERHPERSLLLEKPLRKVKHTGGERIKAGSVEEETLMTWAKYLAGLSSEELRAARQRIAAAAKSERTKPSVRRLTHSQYDHAVRDLLGDQIQPASGFPKEDFINGFRNQVEGQNVSPLLAEAYGKAAERLAAAAFRGGDQRGLVPGRPASVNDASLAEKFVRQIGRKAFRRPLLDGEVKLYTTLCLEEASRGQDFYDGAAIVVEAMLQSPHFLFRIDRSGENAQYEIASRLSLFLWDTTPNDELLNAAANGQLGSHEQIEATARRMLADPQAKQSLEEFLSQWLRFDRVLSATRDRRRFREFTSETAAAMAEETKRLFNHLVWNDQNFMEFFTANYTFVNSDLAKIYGLPAPEVEFGRVEYPADSGRSGVLGHGSFLVLTSKPAETSPTARGLFVRNHFLGQEIPPPPPGVNAVLPTVSEERPLTNRQRLEVHLNSESCAGCHRLIDPIGLGFEQYNAIGAFSPKMSLVFGGRRGEARGQSATMKELDLDTSAYIQGMEDSSFSTPKELGRILANSPACQKCIVKQLFRYAFGREETEADQAVIEDLVAKFRGSGYRFKELIVALVTSDLFLH
ncbi:MAG TPA: DUF1592 domain-containing protein [Pirellulaceae bacterium]